MTANRHQAYRLLQCLTVASRPLRVEELAEILALDYDGAKEGIPELKEDWRWKDQQEAVLSTCAGLISVVDNGRHRVVQFSHFSVKEFLTSGRLASSADVSDFHIRLEPAHTVIVGACLGILLQSDNGVGDAKAKSSSPLAKYAAKHWVDHAQFGKVSTSAVDGMRRLFDFSKPHFTAWLKLYDIDMRWDDFVGYNGNIPRGSPLYYASLCGFRDLAAHLVDEHPQHVNARVGQNRSPLVAALRNKHFHTAELLHQRGADVGIRGDVNRTLLHAASVNGLVDIAQWLLAHGADANSREDNRETPLHLAVKNGRIEFVRMLIKHGVIVNAKNKVDRTSLHLASEGGHVAIARLLLKEIVTTDRHHVYRLLQCLTMASRPLRVEELAEILALDFDEAKEGIPELKEDWRWKDQQEAVLSNWSSLIPVAENGRHLVVHFSQFSKEFLTPDDVSDFHIPPELAHTVIVKVFLGILLQSDNEVGEAEAKSSSPLAKYAAKHWVDHAQFGKVSTSAEDGMRRLFDFSKPYFTSWLNLYDIDMRWNDFVGYNSNIPRGSPLYFASLCGFRDLAAHLVDEHPQYVNTQVGQNRSPLVAALRNKHFHTAELLHQRGADVGIRGGVNRTLLHAASVNGLVDIAQWLLAHGADANSREDNRETPLHLAVKNGQVEFVRMLIKHGVIVNAKNKVNRTSLHLASEGGHVEIVWLLLEHGADVAAQDLRHSTPLHLASSWVSVKTV